MQYSVQTIADKALNMADMRNNDFIDTSDNASAELIEYLNMAYSDLYTYISQVNKNYYTDSYDIPIVSGTDTYDTPDELMFLEGVDVLFNSTDPASNNWVTLDEYNFAERNKGRNQSWLPYNNYSIPLKYRLVGSSQIKFVPIPTAASVARLWYTPMPPAITSFEQTIDTIANGDTFMALYCAILMKQKEESDTQDLVNQITVLWNRIKSQVPQRNLDRGGSITDTKTLNYGSVFPWRLW